MGDAEMIASMPQPGDTNYVRCDSDNTTDSMTFYGVSDCDCPFDQLDEDYFWREYDRAVRSDQRRVSRRPERGRDRGGRSIAFNGKRKFVG